jgi:hypothetical protein
MANALKRIRSLLGSCAWVIQRGFPFWLRFNGIVFLGGYPTPERRLDGYFQRISAIDSLFPNTWKMYVDHEASTDPTSWFEKPEVKTVVVRLTSQSRNRRLLMAAIVMVVLRCRRIYFHSVMRMEDNGLGKLLYIPLIRKILDVHGVVPEECMYQNDPTGALLYGRHESIAMARCSSAIFVTNAMVRHFQKKYPLRLPQVIVYPVFNNLTPCPARTQRPYVDGKPVVVYAGGLQSWQQVGKMVDAMVATSGFCIHRFYCPDPQYVVEQLPARLRSCPSITVETKTHEELLESYSQCHFGLLLRADSIVNNVACPTKFVEYLAMGIVPILDCEDIGDFRTHGTRYIRLDDFMAGRLPEPHIREQMAADNLRVHGELKESAQLGAIAIRASLGI